MVTEKESAPKQPTRKWLEQENARLQKLAEHDELTGLFNRGEAERRVNRQVQSACRGALVMLDIDDFKLINDNYGHLAGDGALRELGFVLEKLLVGRLVARVGGDEFLAFLPEVTREDDLAPRAEQIMTRLSQITVEGSDVNLSVTVGTALCRPGDTYLTLFARADEMLLKKKRKRGDRPSTRVKKTNQFLMDTNLIANDLRESVSPSGAFCQSYEAFQSIFRFLERALSREDRDGTNNKSTVVLFTLADSKNAVPVPECRERQMVSLRGEIENGLRLNDIFVQYSSAQYLVLLYGTDESAAELVSARICNAFYEKNPAEADKLILHHSFPLKPIEKKRSRRGQS